MELPTQFDFSDNFRYILTNVRKTLTNYTPTPCALYLILLVKIEKICSWVYCEETDRCIMHAFSTIQVSRMLRISQQRI